MPGCCYHDGIALLQARKLYIDGYNALRKIRQFEKLMKSNADAARRGFSEHVRTRLQSGARAVIVFDGAGESISDAGPVTVVFSFTRSADSWIRNALESERNPATVLVVSSDHEVMNHALACGAQSERSEDFLEGGTRSESIPDAAEKPEDRALNDDEVAEWLALFSKGGR